MREWAEWSSQGIEYLAIVTIVVSIIFGSLRFLLQVSTRAANPYRAYKELLGRSLLLSLEFLIAADIIRTVLLNKTIQNVGILGALVVIRTLISWSVVVEIEGRWPWCPAVQSEGPRAEVHDSGKHVYAAAGGLDRSTQWPTEVLAPPPICGDEMSCSPH